MEKNVAKMNSVKQQELGSCSNSEAKVYVDNVLTLHRSLCDTTKLAKNQILV